MSSINFGTVFIKPVTLIVFSLLFLMCSNTNIKKGNASLNIGDYQLAKIFFEKELMHNPLSYEARLGMGKVLLQNIFDNESDTALWKDALMHLEAARSLQPSQELSILLSDTWYERSRMLLLHEDTLGALSSLSRSIEFYNKNITAINSTGILYFRKGEIEKAEILFKKVIAIDSTHAPGYFNLGMIAWSKNAYSDARKYWRTASKLDPNDDDMIYWLANAEKKMQELSK